MRHEQNIFHNMPRYHASSEVRALKIASVSTADLGKVKLVFADSYFAPLEIENSVVQSFMPGEGDYFLVEADGSQSVMPAPRFEAHFKRVS
jgi:hypothetical protein